MKAIILSVGDELILGQTVDTNSAYLSAKLMDLGIHTLYHLTVDDQLKTVKHAIIKALTETKLLIITGGLGPTQDDLTRQAIADALNTTLVIHPPSLDAIAKRLEGYGKTMSPTNKLQAYHPQGSKVIPNAWGTAPGIDARAGTCRLFAMPGVPHEMKAMFTQSVLPRVRDLLPEQKIILTQKLNTFGIGESTVAEKLGSLCDRSRNPLVGTTVGSGECSIRIRSEFPTHTQAKQALQQTVQAIYQHLDPLVYGQEDQALQDVIVTLLTKQNKTLCTAESCTGGLIGKMLTDVAGASQIYLGGWITYANQAKISELNIEPKLIDQHGAVSELVVLAMAQNALLKSSANYALATTGIAGPDGGSDDKPIGTVWIALAWRDDENNSRVIQQAAKCYHFVGEREAIRTRAAKTALHLLRLKLLNRPWE